MKMITWHYVLALETLKQNKMQYIEFKNKAICLVYHRGKVGAIDDNCPHQQASLSLGRLVNGYVYCPWHKIGFHFATGEALNYTVNAKSYPVKVKEDGIYIGLES